MDNNTIKCEYTKTPLDYQITEYDCGTTTLLNALRYLFKRSEIEIIKDKPFEYNRKVKKERLEKYTTNDFALVRGENSEMIIIERD